MTRVRTFALAFIVVLVGCNSAGIPTTTLENVVSPPSSTATSATTTITVVEPTDACSRGLVWSKGESYAASCFIVPVVVTPSTSGWRSFGASAAAFRFELWNEEREPLLGVQLLAHEPELEPSDAIESVLDIVGIDPISEPTSAMIGGWLAASIDVETAPDPAFAPRQEPEECSRQGSSLQWGYDSWPGYPLVIENRIGGTHEFGLGACLRFRIWAIDMNGTTITATAVAFDTERFDERIGEAASLLETLSILD